MSRGEPQVQLRLEFSAPTRPVEMLLRLDGLQVVVEPRGGTGDVAAAYLDAVGAAVRVGPDGGLQIPVRDLPRLRTLPERVTATPLGPLATLWELLAGTADGQSPVTVTLEDPGTLNLNWQSGDVELNEAFPLASAAALLALEVPLVAQPAAWDALVAAASLPTVLARARVNLDGFIELTSPVPQQLEIAPLPGLFRVDDTHFGLPIARAADLDALTGVIWEQRPPVYDRAPARLPDLRFTLSEHGREELRGLTARLAGTRGQAVIWDHGLGRRIFCLAAVEALEAFPLLVVTSPSAVWAWRRHLELVGRRGALRHDRDDVHLVTYRDLAARSRVGSPAAVIFDDLDRVQRDHPELLDALHRFDGQLDAYRIAAASTFPSDPDDICRFMSVLRPVEFRADVPALVRYPAPADRHLDAHVALYVSRRTADTTPRPPFRRSSTVVLDPPPAILDACEALRQGRSTDGSLLDDLRSLISAGPGHMVGPKVVKALELANTARRAGRRVAVATRFVPTMRLLEGLLRSQHPDCVRGETPTGALAVVLFGESIPDLRSYDVVVVVDYPDDLGAIDRAVGRADEAGNPDEVIVLHLDGTIDDRVAILAALNEERRSAGDMSPVVADGDLAYVLGPVAGPVSQ